MFLTVFGESPSLRIRSLQKVCICVVESSVSLMLPRAGFRRVRMRLSYVERVSGLQEGSTYSESHVYESGLLAPGKAIYSMKLSQTVPEGTYPASVVYSCYSVATMEEQNGAEVKITLEVTK